MSQLADKWRTLIHLLTERTDRGQIEWGKQEEGSFRAGWETFGGEDGATLSK